MDKSSWTHWSILISEKRQPDIVCLQNGARRKYTTQPTKAILRRKKKKMTKPLGLSTNFQEIQSSNEHVQWHYEDKLSKIQIMGNTP